LTYNQALLGNLEEARMYLSFLREEYDSDPNQFDVLKRDMRWGHLVELGTAIDNGKITNQLIVENNSSVQQKMEDEVGFRKQAELVKAICLCSQDLGFALQTSSDFYCYNVEHETRYGRVDLVARDNETIYPIEVKKNGAYHDCIGQIRKYILHFKLGLILKTYQSVKGIVIANHFDNFVLQELKRSEVIAIKYKYKSTHNIEFIRL
jgi:hypothetical protein